MQDLRKLVHDRIALVLAFLGAQEVQEEPSGTTPETLPSMEPLGRKALEDLSLVTPLKPDSEIVSQKAERVWIAEALGAYFEQHLLAR